MSEPQNKNKVRDGKSGRFLPGHKPLYRPVKKPGEIAVPHPTIPGKDTKGRVLPGYSPKQPIEAREKRQAIQDAITPEMVQEAILDVYQCARGSDDPYVKEKLYTLLFDRLVGRPVKETVQEIHKTETKASIDLTRLTQDELDQFERLAGKAVPQIIDTTVVTQEDNATK